MVQLDERSGVQQTITHRSQWRPDFQIFPSYLVILTHDYAGVLSL